jgi:hypothetical protein
VGCGGGVGSSSSDEGGGKIDAMHRNEKLSHKVMLLNSSKKGYATPCRSHVAEGEGGNGGADVL